MIKISYLTYKKVAYQERKMKSFKEMKDTTRKILKFWQKTYA